MVVARRMKSSLGKLALEVCVTLGKEKVLLAASNAASRLLAVPGVKSIGDVHPLDNSRERHERLAVVRSSVVFEIDEDLCRSPVWILDHTRQCRVCSGDSRVIGHRSVAPQRRDLRITVDAELTQVAARTLKNRASS